MTLPSALARAFVTVFGVVGLAFAAPPGLAAKRPLVPDDIFALKDVADPRLSPDGRFVAYEVTSLDAARDKEDSDIWISRPARHRRTVRT